MHNGVLRNPVCHASVVRLLTQRNLGFLPPAQLDSALAQIPRTLRPTTCTGLQAAAGAGRTVVDVDRDLELQEGKRTAAQTERDQLLARVNAARCMIAPSERIAAVHNH